MPASYHVISCKSFIQIINFHGLFCNALRCRILVPVEYMYQYGTYMYVNQENMCNANFTDSYLRNIVIII